jgi:magnesium chelatase family protein
MVSCTQTVCFRGLNALCVDVQVQITQGLPTLTIVGLPDKAVSESRERIKSTLHSLGLSLPAKKIIISLSPADLQKEGSHYDLPIALALMDQLGAIPKDFLQHYLILGELSLDGLIRPVRGVLPSAIRATQLHRGLICPHDNGGEAAWAGDLSILAPKHILELVAHMNGSSILEPPQPKQVNPQKSPGNLKDIRGQWDAKRALLIAAAGKHHLLMSGPPGVGKSLLASRLPSLLPPLCPEESLEVTMIHSLSTQTESQGLITRPPFRAPHHSLSMAALVGGGYQIQPGEISLAHRGVLFLDELPEFSKISLEALRQPLENGYVAIARAQSRMTFPCKVQLIAAMNPCPCGYLKDMEKNCSSAPRCGESYQRRLSGPLLDRFDLFIELQESKASHFMDLAEGSDSDSGLEQVMEVRKRQQERLHAYHDPTNLDDVKDIACFEKMMAISQEGKGFLLQAMDKLGFSARSYHRILQVARTIGDLDNQETLHKTHIAEALSYRHRFWDSSRKKNLRAP